MMILELIKTTSIRASCPACQKRILTDMHVVANLGSGNYAYHYHISCFLGHWRTVLEKIMNYGEDVQNPKLLARANKSKPAWELTHRGTLYKVRGPNSFSSEYVSEPVFPRPKLDTDLMIEGALLGEKYTACVTLDKYIDTYKWLDVRKKSLLGNLIINGPMCQDSSGEWGKSSETVKVYLVEGILK